MVLLALWACLVLVGLCVTGFLAYRAGYNDGWQDAAAEAHRQIAAVTSEQYATRLVKGLERPYDYSTESDA